MIKIIILVCSIISILFALMLSSWIQKKSTNDNKAIKTFYNQMQERSAQFIKAEYIALSASSIPVLVLLTFYAGWVGSLLFAIAIALSFPVIKLGVSVSNKASFKAFLKLSEGDFPGLLRTSFRAGTVVGFCVSGCGLIPISAMFLFLKYDFINRYILFFASGAVFVSLFIAVSGKTYSKAFNLLSADKMHDHTGSIAGAGADYYAAFVCSLVSAISLSDVAVNTGGVTSTFTVRAASIFPVAVAATGIIASLIGSLFYRGRNKKNNARDISLVNIVSGIFTVAGALYLSDNLMQSYRYAFAVSSGIIAGILSGIITEQFAYDNNKFKKTYSQLKESKENVGLIRGLMLGGYSTIIMTIVVCTALVIAYNYANIYGIALAAVGFLSISGTVCSSEIYSGIISNVSMILDPFENEDNEQSVGIVLEQAESKLTAVSRGYSQLAMTLTGISMFFLFIFITDKLTIDFVSQIVMVGIFAGSILTFFYNSILANSFLRIANYDISKSDNEAYYDRITVSIRGMIIIMLFSTILPIVIGILINIKFLIGSLFGMLLTGFLLNIFLGNSGINFKYMSGISLNTIINAILIVALTFSSFLISFSGYFLR